MKKIVIIGSAGAGKSTLARKLGELLKIEVIHLDHHFWQPGWKEYSIKSRIAIQRDFFAMPQWIIEGTYLDSSDDRLNAADTIIFLDIQRLICLWRVIKRRFLHDGYTRDDLPMGCKERIHFYYILKVLIFPHRGRKQLLSKIDKIRHQEREVFSRGGILSSKKTILPLKSSKEVSAFLQSLYIERQTQSAYKENIYLQETTSISQLADDLTSAGLTLA